MTHASLDKLRSIHKLLGEVINEESEPVPLNKQVDPETHLTNEEVQLMRAGMPVSAIKEVRQRTGLTLREAKDLVEAAGVKLGLRVPFGTGYNGSGWTIPLK